MKLDAIENVLEIANKPAGKTSADSQVIVAALTALTMATIEVGKVIERLTAAVENK